MAIPKSKLEAYRLGLRHNRRGAWRTRAIARIRVPVELDLTNTARFLSAYIANALVSEGHCTRQEVQSFLSSDRLTFELAALVRHERKARADVVTVLHLLMNRDALVRIAAAGDEPRVTALLSKQ